MGATCCRPRRERDSSSKVYVTHSSSGYEDEEPSVDEEREWETIPTELEAKDIYSHDGTLSASSQKSHLEFRKLLDYSIARFYIQEYIKKHSKSVRLGDKLRKWLDIQTFKTMPFSESKLSVLYTIYKVMVLGNSKLDKHELVRIQTMIGRMDLNGIFNNIQNSLFDSLHKEVFVPFKLSRSYKFMVEALKRKVNTVNSKDFMYDHVLGKGGFGIVVSVTKKSTGVQYAMKIQRKQKLYDMFGNEKWRADFEKQAFASFKHPFIVELFFAFQTKSLVTLVMSMCAGNDLSKILRKGGPISLNQTRYYTAEVTSALSYLHHLGFIYRDLKPANVLLCDDGHIKLIDFGSVCDVRGTTLGTSNNTESIFPIFAKSRAEEEDVLPLSIYWTNTNTHSTPRKSPINSAKLTFSNSQSFFSTNSDPGMSKRTCSTQKFGSKLSRCESESHGTSINEERLGDGDSCRAKSLIGTYSYMAPEMVVMRMRSHDVNEGYTKAIDWWSLGVTVYKLLFAAYPFKAVQEPHRDAGTLTEIVAATDRYNLLLEPIIGFSVDKDDDDEKLKLNVDVETKDFISKLLTVPERQRLGFGPMGSMDVSSHPFFESIDWIRLENKTLPPPPLPEAWDRPLPTENQRYGSLQDVLIRNKCESWLQEPLQSGQLSPVAFAQKQEEVQAQFEYWDYTSPAAVMQELGHREQTIEIPLA